MPAPNSLSNLKVPFKAQKRSYSKRKKLLIRQRQNYRMHLCQKAQAAIWVMEHYGFRTYRSSN